MVDYTTQGNLNMKLRQHLHAIDPFELQTKMYRNKIEQETIALSLKPPVTKQAISKSLKGNLPSLLPKIEESINKILRNHHA